MRLKLTCLGLIEARQRECSIEVDLVWVAKIPTFLQIWAHLGGTSKHASKICKGKLHLIRVSTSKGNQLQCNYAKVQYPCLLEITYYQSKSCYVYLKYQLPPSTLFLQQRLKLVSNSIFIALDFAPQYVMLYIEITILKASFLFNFAFLVDDKILLQYVMLFFSPGIRTHYLLAQD